MAVGGRPASNLLWTCCDSLQHLIEIAAPGDLAELVRIAGVERNIHPLQLVLRNERRESGKAGAIGGQRQFGRSPGFHLPT